MLGMSELVSLWELAREWNAIALCQFGQELYDSVVLFVGQIPEYGLVHKELQYTCKKNGRCYKYL